MTNLELTPKERVIYVHSSGIDRMACIRIGNKVFAIWIPKIVREQGISKWVQANENTIKACTNSANFYEAFGIDYFKADKKARLKKFPKVIYPIKYVHHPLGSILPRTD